MNTEVLEKIKKLLRLGTSPNQHEAELALKKAHELAIQYDISLSQINVDCDGETFAMHTEMVGKRMPVIFPFVSGLVSKYFGIKLYTGGNRAFGKCIYFVGKEADIEIAKHVYSYLMEAMQVGWDNYYSSHNVKLSFKATYLLGFNHGLDEMLAIRQREAMAMHASYALMVVKKEQKINEFALKKFGKVIKNSYSTLNNRIKNNYSSDVYFQGKEDGRNTKLNAGYLNEC